MSGCRIEISQQQQQSQFFWMNFCATSDSSWSSSICSSGPAALARVKGSRGQAVKVSEWWPVNKKASGHKKRQLNRRQRIATVKPRAAQKPEVEGAPGRLWPLWPLCGGQVTQRVMGLWSRCVKWSFSFSTAADEQGRNRIPENLFFIYFFQNLSTVTAMTC